MRNELRTAFPPALYTYSLTYLNNMEDNSVLQSPQTFITHPAKCIIIQYFVRVICESSFNISQPNELFSSLQLQML